MEEVKDENIGEGVVTPEAPKEAEVPKEEEAPKEEAEEAKEEVVV